MIQILFNSVFDVFGSFSVYSYVIVTLTALILGYVIATVHMIDSVYSKGFVVTLALLPAVVSLVIMMVNGNIGTGIAIAGAFSLVRFRSLPGTAREILSVFLTMTIGLATGMGFVGYAFLFTALIALAEYGYFRSHFGERPLETLKRTIRITVPESLNYAHAFDEVFQNYTDTAHLMGVKTTNMGSMYRLTYSVVLKQRFEEKALIDALRIRNGNLEISVSQGEFGTHEL